MDGVHVGKEEALEKHGHGNARGKPHESPEKAKENDYLGKIFRDMLDILKQVCLLSCFELFSKHHRHSERVMNDLSSQSEEASGTPRAPASSSASNQLPPSVDGGTKDKDKDKDKGKDKDKDKGKGKDKDKDKDKDKGKGKGK